LELKKAETKKEGKRSEEVRERERERITKAEAQFKHSTRRATTIMGAGASSLPRLRKALLMKAYNARSKSSEGSDLTLYEQFLPFAYQREDKMYYINVTQIKACLGLVEDKKEYLWLDELLANIFQFKKESETEKEKEKETKRERDIYLYDFVQFLETGKLVSPFLCVSLVSLVHSCPQHSLPIQVKKIRKPITRVIAISLVLRLERKAIRVVPVDPL
jgi:hypothetical protein